MRKILPLRLLVAGCFGLLCLGLVWFGLVWFGLDWATDLKGHYKLLPNPWVLGGSSAVCFHCHEKRGENTKTEGEKSLALISLYVRITTDLLAILLPGFSTPFFICCQVIRQIVGVAVAINHKKG